MFVLYAPLQAVIILIIIIIVILISIIFVIRKFKNKSKVSLKEIKTIVFNLNEVVEDYMLTTIPIDNPLSYEKVFKALENLVEDNKIKK